MYMEQQPKFIHAANLAWLCGRGINLRQSGIGARPLDT
jgi:hypothetical protein